MKSSARPVLAAFKRAYTAQAAKAAQESVEASARISRLPSGTVVATLENHSPVSRVAVLYNAGSRYEGRENQGVTHAIRAAANLSTAKASGFGVTKNLQQIGANVQCSTSREHFIYSLDCLRYSIDVGLEFLGHMSMRPAFKAWEIRDNNDRLKLELGMLEQDITTPVMEGLHEVAFRDGLGRSLFMKDFLTGSHSPDVMAEFVNQHFVPANMAVVGVGVDHEEFLWKLQHQFGLPREAGGTAVETPKSTYYGGESRVSTNSPFVSAAIVTQGVSLGSKEMLPLAILQNLMGTGPRIKYSSAPHAKISQAAAQATPNPFAASTINLNYSDNGLFGFHIISHSKDAGKVLESVVSHFSKATKGTFTEQEVNKAKNQLKAGILYEMENSGNLTEDMGIQVLLTGQILSSDNIAEAINQVTAADIQAVAKKVINGKPAMSAVGDLTHTPYLDQLL